jgi:hypothetical protein
MDRRICPRDNVDSIFVVPPWCEEDEIFTECLLPMN